VSSIATWGQGFDHKPPRLGFPAYVVSLAFHVGVVALLIGAFMRSSGGSGGGATASQPRGIGAFVSVSTVAPATVAPPRPAAKMSVTRDKTPVASSAAQSGSSAPGAGGTGSGSGPIRLGSGEGLGVISKVQPIYPRLMEIARTAGVVVVDAVILRDGTIGDIKVLSSSGPLFEKAAIDALKQWRYAPMAQEGIITVTINFVLHS